ncbi:pollen-specific leucine-rich repeat extensin-like protein 2 [Homarus americanus]|uniref:pollen-specific leucine-rich repeat extensin-like protein 2 n=1 Tax=Homarus americanus TaxID=6706 RepID=UPI001C449791|nr:pollen-specific leucine-rich repeat extensin-like protein 2 [Homarus americanus]
MATQVDEFTLESVRDYMISRGGRVTNHELVKHFKVYLTNPSCKEIARNKFKQYVNTLANISQEGGEKYLVLKRKYRVGTPLSESEYLSPNSSPSPSHFSSPNQFNIYGSPQHSAAYSPQPCSPMTLPAPPIPSRATPPYRAPPPYRPPPVAAPTHQGYSSPEDPKYGDRRYDPPPQHFNGRHQGTGEPRYAGEPPVYPPGEARYPPVSETRFPSQSEPHFNEVRYPYDEPADLGIPPAPQIRPSTSMSTSSSGLSSYGGSSGPQPSPYVGYNNPPPLATLSASRPKTLPVHQISSVSSTSEDGDSVSVSATTTVSSASTPSSDDPPPPVPPRKRSGDNKENQRPSPEGEEDEKNVMGDEGGEDGDDAADRGSAGGSSGSGDRPEEERKISVSVKEATQKFNRMASESQLLSSSRASSKSNRSSRSDRDDDDSTSILSFGADGQEWMVAAAKSDFNEILRLLKIHPTLARYKNTVTMNLGDVDVSGVACPSLCFET